MGGNTEEYKELQRKIEGLRKEREEIEELKRNLSTKAQHLTVISNISSVKTDFSLFSIKTDRKITEFTIQKAQIEAEISNLPSKTRKSVVI